jgi:CheY-like chemotaxis protein
VEDERLVRLAIRKILATRGHNVLEASDGEAALSLLGQHQGRIDLVLTDLVMPRIGGRELADRIRDMGHPAALLFMSGYAGDTAVTQSLLEPGSAFIEKPFTPEVLLFRIDELLAAAEAAGANPEARRGWSDRQSTT